MSTNIITNGDYSIQTTGNITLDATTVSTTGNISFGNINGGNLTLSGNLTVNGTTTTVNTETATQLSVSGNITGANLLTSGNVSSSGTVIGNLVFVTNFLSAAGNVRGANINTVGQVTATGNVTGGNLNAGVGNVNVGNVNFALDNSKFNSAKWTLVETFNANLASGNQSIATTHSYNYYSTNYNELLFSSSSGSNIGETLVVPVSLLTANSVWNVNQQVGFQWANLSDANVTVVSIGAGPYTTVEITMYAR